MAEQGNKSANTGKQSANKALSVRRLALSLISALVLMFKHQTNKHEINIISR